MLDISAATHLYCWLQILLLQFHSFCNKTRMPSLQRLHCWKEVICSSLVFSSSCFQLMPNNIIALCTDNCIAFELMFALGLFLSEYGQWGGFVQLRTLHQRCWHSSLFSELQDQFCKQLLLSGLGNMTRLTWHLEHLRICSKWCSEISIPRTVKLMIVMLNFALIMKTQWRKTLDRPNSLSKCHQYSAFRIAVYQNGILGVTNIAVE